MKQTELIMGMPITVEVIDETNQTALDNVFDWFRSVDRRFSTYKEDSEISKINRGLPKKQWSKQMKPILKLCEQTKRQSNGYFDISRRGELDPSGLVKGWSVNEAAKLLKKSGLNNFYVEAGGDIAVSGSSGDAKKWLVGIRNPFDTREIIKVVAVTDCGVATSGTYIRGQHVYNPLSNFSPVKETMSLSVIGPDIYEADRFATAAFAMGEAGIDFIERLEGLEGYMVNNQGIAIYTSGFEAYVQDTD